MVVCLEKSKSSLDMDCSLGDPTRQVVARAIGDRSEKTCRELWDNIPDEYRKGRGYRGFLESISDSHGRSSN